MLRTYRKQNNRYSRLHKKERKNFFKKRARRKLLQVLLLQLQLNVPLALTIISTEKYNKNCVYILYVKNVLEHKIKQEIQ